MVQSPAGPTGDQVATAATAAASIGQLIVVRPAGPNQPPTFDQDLADRSDDEGAAISLSAHATDPDGDPLTYAASGLPTGLSINPSTGLVSGTISTGAATGSPYPVSITVSQDGGTTVAATDTLSWTVTVPPPPTGIVFRAASTGANNVGNNVVVPVPAGQQSGDVLVAVIDVKAVPTVTTPAGWTLVSNTINGSAMRQLVYWRVATGASEPPSYTWTYNENRAASGSILAYAGVNTADPIQTFSAGLGSTTSITAPSVTTTVDGSMIVGGFGINADSTITPPPGMTERGEIVSATRLRTEVCDVLLTSAGATGDQVATAATAAASVGQLIALRPA
jgi:hypothetical protein